MGQRDFDVVVYGATGFVGKLTAAYLAAHAPDGARIALGGRSRSRLEDVRQRLGGPALGWDIVVADSGDRAALDEMAQRTRVVATTVGPYVRYGLPLVAACADAGTHYADLTGELAFMRTSIDRCHEVARSSRARIVHGAGFDSIPSDLGVLVLHEAVARDGAGDLGATTFAVTGLRGGVSGGTVASMKEQVQDMTRDAGLRRLVSDPYALSPQRDKEPALGDERDLRKPERDPMLGQWVAPFVMAGVNTRVVRRSNALSDWAYGRSFRYREVVAMGSGPAGLAKAAGLTGGLGLFAGALTLPPTRSLLDRVLPKPGEGPSEKTRTNGFFRIEIHTTTTTGARYVAEVAAKGDPGYAATAVMLGESALALAATSDALPDKAGVLTPATALGTFLVERLRTAGFTLQAKRN